MMILQQDAINETRSDSLPLSTVPYKRFSQRVEANNSMDLYLAYSLLYSYDKRGITAEPPSAEQREKKLFDFCCCFGL
jgi:hypothetical protein